jgi:hypothetical protein
MLLFFRDAGVDELVAMLARRASARAGLSSPYSHNVSILLETLRTVGAYEEAMNLIARLPAAGMLRFLQEHDAQIRFRFGQDVDSAPAAPWTWENLG